jgi:hypothetical protein
MSYGSPIVKCRVAPLVLAAIETAIESANKTRKQAPYNLSTWLQAAIADKLDKLARRKKSDRKKRAAVVATKP